MPRIDFASGKIFFTSPRGRGEVDLRADASKSGEGHVRSEYCPLTRPSPCGSGHPLRASGERGKKDRGDPPCKGEGEESR